MPLNEPYYELRAFGTGESGHGESWIRLLDEDEVYTDDNGETLVRTNRATSIRQTLRDELQRLAGEPIQLIRYQVDKCIDIDAQVAEDDIRAGLVEGKQVGDPFRKRILVRTHDRVKLIDAIAD